MDIKRRIHTETYERKVTQLKTVAHPLRLAILWYIKNNPNSPVYKVANALNIPPGIVSIHLSNMRHKEIVRRKRKGKEVTYSINKSVYDDLIRMVTLEYFDNSNEQTARLP